MTQLLDLDDDCLLEVLDRLSPEQLFKMLLLNKRLNQLAIEKIRTKIRAIEINESYDLFADCFHLDAGLISRDQVLFLWPMFRCDFMDHPSSRGQFLNILSKCSSVKSIDFNISELRGDFLLEMVSQCPSLECIKFGKSDIKKEDWDKVLNQIGHQIVHIVQKRHEKSINFESNRLSIDKFISMIAVKCPNIKRIDWSKNGCPKWDLLAAFEELPECCWITVNCDKINEEFAFNNVVVEIDELTIETLDWSLIDGHRFDRLSSIKINKFDQKNVDLILGVNFANLKKFDISDCYHFNDKFYDYLLASRFPRLEEFSFFVNDDVKNYKAMFCQFVSIKKLTVDWQWPKNIDSLVSNIYLLTNLETVHLFVRENAFDPFFQIGKKYFQCLKRFFQSLDGIGSMKKLKIEVEVASDELASEFGQPKIQHFVVDEVRRMKTIKQNVYKIDLIIKVCV